MFIDIRVRRWLSGYVVFTLVLLPSLLLYADDEIAMFVGHYQDNAKLTVLSPSLRVSKDIDEGSRVTLKYGFENFSKKGAVNSGEQPIDALSGATTVSGGVGGGFNQDRHELSLSGNMQFAHQTLTGGIYSSKEVDFFSRGFSAGYSHGFLQNNLTLSTTYSYILDDIEANTIAAPDTQEKTSHTLSFSLTQLLSSVSLVNAGYSYGYTTGYQSQPLRKIVITKPFADEIYDEFHPDERSRHTLFVGGRYYWLSRTSLLSGLSLYVDDWGVNAIGTELTFNQYLADRWILQGRVRHYYQSTADFYQQTYSERQTIMTADTRLRSFHSILAGVKLTYRPPSFIRGWRFSIAYNRYQATNNGLNANILKFSTIVPY